MNAMNQIISLDEARKSRKRFVRSLEYELIASLALHQYAREGKPDYAALLSIPLNDRIPGLLGEYGLKRMHRLIKTILNEFSYSIPLPKSKKLTETRSAAVACDLILVAEEDQLALEDPIIFFELAKEGKWGKFKTMVTHYAIMEKLEQFRQERYEVYVQLRAQIEAEQKAMGPQERISPEPTLIKNLFDEQEARIVPMKKIG